VRRNGVVVTEFVRRRHELTWNDDGTVSGLYADALRPVVEAIGPLAEIKRCSHIEPAPDGQWWIYWAPWVRDTWPAGWDFGDARPQGPFATKGDAEAAEKHFLWHALAPAVARR
jgi:hypothetical protein